MTIMDINNSSKDYKQRLLDELYAPYKKCTMCPLGFLGRSTVVFGQGNPNAHLMIIGEGPGKDEDEQGQPFVGRSGRLLTKALETVGLVRSELFITNVVKCRPPNNRKPTQLESSTCKNLLLFKQIAIIQPTVICTLGSTALEGLLGKKITMTHTRGRELTLPDKNIIIIPTYHPAYALRNPKELATIINDLQQAKNRIQIDTK